MKKCGAKCVIAINTKTTVFERAAREFNERFIDNLIQGKRIIRSFNGAIAHLNRNENHACCCAHSTMHKPGCPYIKFVKQI